MSQLPQLLLEHVGQNNELRINQVHFPVEQAEDVGRIVPLSTAIKSPRLLNPLYFASI